MNVHYCPKCGHGFWARGNLGEATALPRHLTSGKVANRSVSALVCEGSGKRITNVKPPTSST